MLTDIKAVIFDMDGTLIDSIWVWAQVDIDYLKNLNLELPPDLRRAIEGLSFTETAIYFKNRFDIKDSIKDIMQDWTNMVEKYYCDIIEIKKGVTEFLIYLKEHNYKIGMATSNSSNLVKPVLERNNIYQYFDKIVTTDEVPRDKSFPDVFIETSRRLGVIPSECLVFEDTLCAILSAKSAGMRVVGVYDKHGTSTLDEIAEISDHFIEDFEYILKLNAKKK